MKKYNRVWIDIDLDAVRANLSAMQAHILPGMQLCAVVKTDGYGHGAVPVAQTVEEQVWGFAVATREEAENLRLHGISKPVLVLGYTDVECAGEMAEAGIRPTVFSLQTAQQLSANWKSSCHACRQSGKSEPEPLHIHIGIDTGMGRIGFLLHDETTMRRSIEDIVAISRLEGLEIEGMFTHFARADERDPAAAELQVARFRNMTAALQAAGIRIPVIHCANSAAIVMLHGVGMTMARAGITLYGLYPSEEVDASAMAFAPVLSMHTQIICLKDIPQGTTVSYGGTFVAPAPMRLATLPVGYGDGYPRSLSNKGYVLIHGQIAPICGRICMDQLMVDVTGIPQAAEGDCVTLIGTDGAHTITVEELGTLSGRFNYEFVCDLGKRIPRIYHRDGGVIGAKDYSLDRYEDFLPGRQ